MKIKHLLIKTPFVACLLIHGHAMAGPTLSIPITISNGYFNLPGTPPTDKINDQHCTSPCTISSTYGNNSYLVTTSFGSSTTNPSTSAAILDDGSLEAVSNGEVGYSLQVYLPDAGTSPVPIIVDETASAAVMETNTVSNPSVIAFSSISITHSTSGHLIIDQDYCAGIYETIGVNPPDVNCMGPAGNVVTTFTLTDEPVLLYANQTYNIGVTSSANTDNSNSISTYADPSFAINPISLADYPDAELVLSPGIFQSAVPTPEPTSLGLLMLGVLGLLGTKRLQQRRRPSTTHLKLVRG